jgi:hypothetical protein
VLPSCGHDGAVDPAFAGMTVVEWRKGGHGAIREQQPTRVRPLSYSLVRITRV